jgi:hypothetical protein
LKSTTSSASTISRATSLTFRLCHRIGSSHSAVFHRSRYYHNSLLYVGPGLGKSLRLICSKEACLSTHTSFNRYVQSTGSKECENIVSKPTLMTRGSTNEVVILVLVTDLLLKGTTTVLLMCIGEYFSLDYENDQYFNALCVLSVAKSSIYPI